MPDFISKDEEALPLQTQLLLTHTDSSARKVDVDKRFFFFFFLAPKTTGFQNHITFSLQDGF